MTTDFEFPAFVRDLPGIDLPVPGARGWTLQGPTQQAVFLEFEETVEIPDHSHGDQWELPLAGRVELRSEGSLRRCGPGEMFFIPAGQVHGATVSAGYKAVVFFDAPDRYPARG